MGLYYTHACCVHVNLVIKKIYKSKRTYAYNFNDNGYAIAISLDKVYIDKDIERKFLQMLSKNNLRLNLSKTDAELLPRYDKKNHLFMSAYKKKIERKDALSR